jgi:hypothetical protein
MTCTGNAALGTRRTARAAYIEAEAEGRSPRADCRMTSLFDKLASGLDVRPELPAA